MKGADMLRINGQTREEMRIDELCQDVWDLLWVRFDGEPDLDTIEVGEICAAAKNAVREELTKYFEE